jgi:hypothetical protein
MSPDTKYDAAKERAASRPVKTEHGNVGEAGLRDWLTKYLPKKFAVTSGYIIPDLIQSADYNLFHYDIIVYDALNAPILWVEENPDYSEVGKPRAIPARYVFAVFEVKSTFGKALAAEALQKLGELNAIAGHFPPQFSSYIIFIDLPSNLVGRGEDLGSLLPAHPIIGFRGGLIIRCGLNILMSGMFYFHKGNGQPGIVQTQKDVPFAKNVDELNIYINSEGACVIEDMGGEAGFVSDGVSNWMVSKGYGPTFCRGDICVGISWSVNSFAAFAFDLVLHLEGRERQQEKGYQFAQVFDRLERR